MTLASNGSDVIQVSEKEKNSSLIKGNYSLLESSGYGTVE
jgi:hypothetical protein